jgi:hypothetical protein
VWSIQQRALFMTAAITTARGAGFVGDRNQEFKAFDVRNQKVLWTQKLATAVQGLPATFSANGKQYVIVTTGRGMAAPGWCPTPLLRKSIRRPPASTCTFKHCRTGSREDDRRGWNFRWRRVTTTIVNREED